MKYGYTGKILTINLDSSQILVEERDDLFYSKYMGGSCLAAYYLLKKLPPGIDPFSKDNIIIFSTSPLTGAPCPGTAMHSVISKSPLTNLIGESVTPGFLGVEIKKAGYDAIILKGKVNNPSYVFVKDGEVRIMDAKKIWGMPVSKAYEQLIDDLNDEQIKIALIGPAGEKLIKYASIVNDMRFISSRYGLGAVLGSKNIKAVCIRGTGEINVRYPDKLKKLSYYFKNNFLSNPSDALHHDQPGTAAALKPASDAGLMSCKNFKTSYFTSAGKINGDSIIKNYKVNNINCPNCFVGCKKSLKGKKGGALYAGFGQIELETLASCVYNPLIDDPEYAIKIWDMVCDFGLDGTSLGSVISFAMECYEKKIITQADTGGLDLNWGNGEAVLGLVNLILNKEKIGNILADGVRYASSVIGGSEELAIHIKGLEIPMHEPRVKQMLGLGYAVSPIGPYYTAVEHDTDFDFYAPQLFMDKISSLALYERFESELLNDKKVRLFYFLHSAFSMLDSLCCCIFAFSPVRFFNYQELVDISSAVTGKESSLLELIKIGEKRINLYKLFATREGFGKKDDTLPARFFEPIESGPKSGVKINKSEFSHAVETYYQIAGWDGEGVPGFARLLELDITEFSGN